MKYFGSNEDVFLRQVLVVFLILFGSGFLLGFFLRSGNFLSAYGFLVFIFLMVLLLWFEKGVLLQADRSITGIIGERRISVILDALYLDGIKHVDGLVLDPPYGNIDHLVVAPSGVWVVESKAIRLPVSLKNGVLMMGNKLFPPEYLTQVNYQMNSVGRFLRASGFVDVPVKKIIVFSQKYSKVRVGDDPIQGTYIIGSSYLSRILLKKDVKFSLSKLEIDKLYTLFLNKLQNT